MRNNMTADEFKALRTGETTEEDISVDKKVAQRQEFVDAMTTKAFIMARTTETISVPITSDEGVKNIDIRCRLNKAETKTHAEFLKVFRDAGAGNKGAIEYLDTPEGYLVTAAFMAQITSDPQLDTPFWMSDDIDPATIQEILIAYFTEPARRRVEIEKFRKERIRSELCGDVKGVGTTPDGIWVT